jgi:hypothetical protein
MVHTNARPPHHEDLPPSRARRDPQFDQRDAFEHGDVAFAAAGGVQDRFGEMMHLSGGYRLRQASDGSLQCERHDLDHFRGVHHVTTQKVLHRRRHVPVPLWRLFRQAP